MLTAAWSVDSQDWCDASAVVSSPTDCGEYNATTGVTAQQILTNVREGAPISNTDATRTGGIRSGGIILMHDNEPSTAASIPLVINALAAKGLLLGKLASTTLPQAGPLVPLPYYYVTAVAP